MLEYVIFYTAHSITTVEYKTVELLCRYCIDHRYKITRFDAQSADEKLPKFYRKAFVGTVIASANQNGRRDTNA